MAHDSDTELRFRVLVPVWGERYIRDFCAISLPALLADGNLPQLACAGDCEIIFLTTQASRPAFEKSDGIRMIEDVCGYSFITIDDLLPFESYGIILTLAYGRGIASLGHLQTSTHFVFLNADFVLSNGILRTVVDRISKGFRAVMAPSLRAEQEEVVQDLEQRVRHTGGTLDASPRTLVSLTLKSLHITARASLVNQHLLHHNAANQFFWQVDEKTLIGRFFLLFMLCIRPEKEYEFAKGWCDYVFVPDLVPSGKYDVITDSDHGFILEMQASRGEAEYIMAGRIPVKAFAPRLSQWATVNHRDYATRTVVFHAGPLPADYAAVEAEANSFMAELFKHLKQPPVSHLHHPYWKYTVPRYQRNFTPSTMPKELPWIKPPLSQSVWQTIRLNSPSLGRLRAYLVRNLIGTPPNVSPLHHGYLDYQNFSAEIAILQQESTTPLWVRERPSTVDTCLANIIPLTTVWLSELHQFRSDGEKFDGVIITLVTSAIPEFPRLLRLIAAHCKDAAPVVICIDAIEQAFYSGRFSVYAEAVSLMQASIGGPITGDSHRMITSMERLAPVYRLMKLRELLASRSTSARIGSLIIGLPALARILLANLRPKPSGPADYMFCSSATMRLRGPWQSMTQDLIRKACRFDPDFYTRTNANVANVADDPEAHFLEFGWKEGRDPSDHFSVTGYLDVNPDVAAANVNPWTHFLEFGVKEGRNGWQK